MLKIGDKVWYRSGSEKLAGIIDGVDEKEGRIVYDVAIQNFGKGAPRRWGYENQFETR